MADGLEKAGQSSPGSEAGRRAFLLRAQMTLGLALEALAQEAIPSLVLKGGHLAWAYYPSPLDRPFCDLDLLVPQRSFRRAVALLAGRGFTLCAPPRTHRVSVPLESAWSLNSPWGVPLEVHWKLGKHGAFREEWGGAFERSEPFSFQGVSARGSAPEDLLLQLAIHAARTGFLGIEEKHLHDFSVVAQRRPIRWDLFVERARRARCATGAHFALLHARRRGAPIPVGVVESLAPRGPRGWWLRRRLGGRLPHEVEGAVPVWPHLLLATFPLYDPWWKGPLALAGMAGTRVCDLFAAIRGTGE